MIWSDFYDNYTEWSESTIRSRISSLEDMGNSDEIVDVVIDLPNEKLKAQLIRKAIRCKVLFTHDDFMNLDGELPDEVYRELAIHSGFDANNPYLDEDNLTWDDFYSEYYDWSEVDTLRRIKKLKNFGSSEEVCEVICGMPNSECEESLYQKAIASGVKFADDELEEMGKIEFDAKGFLDNLITDEDIAQVEEDVAILCDELDRLDPSKQPKPQRKGLGFFGTLFAIIGAFAGTGKSKHNSHHCDGDCANCPPHYGYRYGRWYYGHGHQYGCQRGGNGGASGRTYKD